MRSPKIICTLLLVVLLTYSACWDSFVISRDNKKKDIPENKDSIQIDSNSLKPSPPQEENNPKRNRALDTLKPGIALEYVVQGASIRI